MHATPIADSSDFEMTAVCDIDKDARDRAQERFGCPVYEDYHEMLSRESLDLVVIVTYNHQHAPMACDCMQAGTHVLVTKPWAVDAAQAESMIAVAERTGQTLLPWLPSRWGCQLAKLQEIKRANAIGEIFQVRRSVYTFGRRYDWQTRSDHAGGYLRNWGPHIVDQPIQLLGENVASVHAQMRQVINPGDVEDVFHAVFTLKTGEIITCEHNIATGPYQEWVVQGSRGTVHITGQTCDMYQVEFGDSEDTSAYRGGNTTEHVQEQIPGAVYGDEKQIYQHIAGALKGEEEYFVPLESALYLTKLLDAIRQSAMEHTTIYL